MSSKVVSLSSNVGARYAGPANRVSRATTASVVAVNDVSLSVVPGKLSVSSGSPEAASRSLAYSILRIDRCSRQDRRGINPVSRSGTGRLWRRRSCVVSAAIDRHDLPGSDDVAASACCASSAR